MRLKSFEKILSGCQETDPLNAEYMNYLYAGGYVTAGADSRFMIAKEVTKAYETVNTS